MVAKEERLLQCGGLRVGKWQSVPVLKKERKKSNKWFIFPVRGRSVVLFALPICSPREIADGWKKQAEA